jgi:hypothetical protein
MRTTTRLVAGAVAIAALALAGPVYAQAGGDRGGGGGGGGGSHSGGSGGGGSAGVSASNGGSSGSYGGGSTSSSSGGSSGGGSSATAPGASGGGANFGGARGNGGAARGTSPLGGVRGIGADRNSGGAVMVHETGGRSAVASDPGNAAIPGGARPNYSNVAVGTAVPRGSTSGGGTTSGGTGSSSWNTWNGWWSDSNYGYGYYPSYPGYRYGSNYYGYGSYCDPFFLSSCSGLYGLNYGDPWIGGGGSSGAYGGWEPPFGAASGGGGGYSSSYSSSNGSQSGPKGGLKLKVSPKDAEVYVDGYYLGRVDDYNGAFQRLELPVGLHKIELRANSYESVNFEVKIEARDIVTYRGAMQQLQPPK